MRASLLPLLLSLLGSTGCVDTSPDRVKLVVRVERVEIAVATGALVTSLSGGFQLALEVGDLASGSATIQDPPSIQLVAAADQAMLTVLDALPEGAGFPVTLASGASRTLPFTLTAGNTLVAAEAEQVCAGPVQVAVTIQDSLKGDKPTLAESAAVSLTGCP